MTILYPACCRLLRRFICADVPLFQRILLKPVVPVEEKPNRPLGDLGARNDLRPSAWSVLPEKTPHLVKSRVRAAPLGRLGDLFFWWRFWGSGAIARRRGGMRFIENCRCFQQFSRLFSKPIGFRAKFRRRSACRHRVTSTRQYAGQTPCSTKRSGIFVSSAWPILTEAIYDYVYRLALGLFRFCPRRPVAAFVPGDPARSAQLPGQSTSWLPYSHRVIRRGAGVACGLTSS